MSINPKSINQKTTNAAAAEVPSLTPEAVVEQLRAMRAQIAEVTPLTSEQRRLLRNRGNTKNPVLQASINVIDALENVSQALRQPAAEVRQLHDEANRWTAVEDELRTMLAGVVGANLVRRQRVALIAAQAYRIGSQLARDPAYAVLVPHLQEIKRLKRSAQRKKTAEDAEAPPAPAPKPSEKPQT